MLYVNAEAITEDVSFEVSQTENSRTINDAEGMAKYLRQEFGIAKSVYLTQIAQQLSQSFASSEQLKQQWQQALSTEIIEPAHFTQINTHALMAQTLVQQTNGMTLDRFRQVNLPLTPHFSSLNDPYVRSRTFQTWLNLNYHWQNILIDGGQKNMAQWLPWLIENPEKISTHKIEPNNVLDLVLSGISEIDDENVDQLISSVNHISYFSPLAVALMRQKLHLIKNQTIALGYDWIEIYQLLEFSSDLLTAEQQEEFSKLITQAQNHWIASEEKIKKTNEPLYALIDDLLYALPDKFKNPDHFNDQLNSEILTLITGLENPDAYFSHPLRQEIQENLEVCLNLSVLQNPEPPTPIASKQFNDCLREFVTWGTDLANNANLSGNLIQLDNPSSINRALDLPAVQVINNLSMQAASEITCQQQLSTQANLLEWLLSAETVAWFHDRWPGLMATNSPNSQIDELISVGEQLFQFPDCVNDKQPLLNQFSELQSKWERLKQEIVIHVNQYRNNVLSPNSDVDLFKTIDQKSNYIPESFVISPCDSTQSCGAQVTLNPNNDLLNLFPNHLRLASQFGLGELEICYDQVRWEQRKTTPTHLDNNKIANFEGQLSIQLNGIFQGQSVFTKSLLSEQRHTYLFGENNQETLDTACPLPLVGKQINTSLDRGTFGLFPNRLTFLAAQKIDINKVMENNWKQWQTQLNANPDEFSSYNEMNEIKTALNDAFLKRVDQLQQQIYRKLITNNQSRTNDSALSKAAFEYITHRKLLSHMSIGLFPQLYANRPSLQAALSGNDRLVDMAFFREAYENQINVAEMIENGDLNFSAHQSAWDTINPNESLVHSTLDQLRQVKTFTQSPKQANSAE